MQHWDDLRYLLALEQKGSLVQAAKLLKTNPTTVSRHIKRLSETYKKTLVTRQPNGEWSLTKEGLVFASTAKRCDIEIDALNSDTADTAPEITITTTEFIGEQILTPKVRNVISSDEDFVLTLDMRDRNVSLAFGEADLAIRLGRPTSGKLIASKLSDIEMNAFSVNGEVSRRWVGLPAQFDWAPEMQFGLEFFGCEPIMRAGSFSMIREVAADHHLACIGPTFMMEGWHGLQILDRAASPAIREVWSVFHESRQHDDALSSARRWAKECFSDFRKGATA